MCGIAGVYALNQKPLESTWIEPMARAIRHRGPDEEGFFKTTQVQLAIQRLKVIDLVTGSQPVFNESRKVTVVFNGEIYNYKALREQLKAKGHTFTSQSDTETIVHLYEEYQEECVQHLTGMFAFALWDAEREKLLLARDPGGIKPLFYSTHEGRLLFASEMKAILGTPHFPRNVRPQAIAHYLSYYYVTAPLTIYQNIERLPAGCRLIAERGRVRIEKYTDLSFTPDPKPSLQEWEKRFVQTLDQSVQSHLQSDVPVGVFLSGGLDSASLVAMASRTVSSLNTFTIGYAERSYSELDEARTVAKRFGTRHHEVILSPQEFQDNLPKMIAQLDEPQGDWSSVASYVLSREVKKDATVVLSGAGGDELMGGYPTLLAGRVAGWYRRMPAWLRSSVISPLLRQLPVGRERMSWHFMAQSFLRGAESPAELAHQRFKEIFHAEERRELLTERAHHVLSQTDPFDAFSQHQLQYKSMSDIDRLLYLDYKVFLSDCSLYLLDIASSAHAVECRVPFLDKNMLALASQIPSWYKVHGWTTKYLFRRAMRSFLPQDILKMKKKGLLVPGAPWMAGPLKPMILEVISQSENRLKHLFNYSYIRRLIMEHFDQKADHTRRISALVSLMIWDAKAQPSWPEF